MVRCHLCANLVPTLHCVICDEDLCKDCEKQHCSDESKEHRVVPLRFRRCFTKCPKHSSKPCTYKCMYYCMECDIPLCVRCNSSMEHRDHRYVDVMEKLKMDKLNLKRDLKELATSIFPKYHAIKSTIPIQKDRFNENSKELTRTIDKHGENLHKEVDNVINELKSEVSKINSKYLHFLDKQEDEIKCTISEIAQNIAELRLLLDSNDISLVSAYKSRNATFRKLPHMPTFFLPTFVPQKINKEKIYEEFGSLSELSIKQVEYDCTIDSLSAKFKFSTTNKTLVYKPRILKNIDTGHVYGLHSVSCSIDGYIWTCTYKDNIINLYNLQGKSLESIPTKSGNRPGGITVTKGGDLVYTDYDDRTVNILKNAQIQTIIRLQGWKPRGVCCTSINDLLVTMTNDDDKQSKIVRYSGSTEKQTYQYDDKGQPLYSSGDYIKYISENSNLDLCVVDNKTDAVVVVNQFGKLRFIYTGPSSTTQGSFNPVGITTDSQSRILIADYRNNCIHILTQGGQFLRYIDNCDLHWPWGLCVDTMDNLFVTEFIRGRVKKIQYCI